MELPFSEGSVPDGLVVGLGYSYSTASLLDGYSTVATKVHCFYINYHSTSPPAMRSVKIQICRVKDNPLQGVLASTCRDYEY